MNKSRGERDGEKKSQIGKVLRTSERKVIYQFCILILKVGYLWENSL